MSSVGDKGMGPRGADESWKDWITRIPVSERARCSIQKPVSREEILAAIHTPEPFITWLQHQRPNTEVAEIFSPGYDLLAEYLWAELEVFASAADSVVWIAEVDGFIEWDDLPAWVQSLNRVEARYTQIVPDGKLRWTASEALAMVYEAIGTNETTQANRGERHDGGT